MKTAPEKPAIDMIEFVWIWNHLQNMSTPAHQKDMAHWLAELYQSRHSRQTGGVLMAFRNSGKSTLVGLFCAWVLLCDDSTRILAMAADHSLATKMVRNVRHIIERHPLTCHLTPDKREQWSSSCFTIKRTAELRDASMQAYGLGANVTGSRADIIICDDVEVPKTCDTSGKRENLRNTLDELSFVLVPGGLQLYVGTPHAFDTIYRTKKSDPPGEQAENLPFLKGFKAMRLPVADKRGKPSWPERFGKAAINAMKKRVGMRKFASQMMLTPQNPKDARLDPACLTRYDAPIKLHSANGEHRLSINGVQMVSAACMWDPAFGVGFSGDGSVIAAVFFDNNGGCWLHDLSYIHVPKDKADQAATEQCRQVAAFVRKNMQTSVMVETNGLGRFLPGLLRAELAASQTGCAVVEISQNKAKVDRILSAFEPLLANRALQCHGQIYQTGFVSEMRDWSPEGKAHDDALDAVAGCLLAEPVRIPKIANTGNRPSWRGSASPVQANTDFAL